MTTEVQDKKVEAEPEKTEKYVESPEDIEKHRALLQQQSQEKSEKLKEVELTADQLRQERDDALGRLNQYQIGSVQEPEPKKKTELAKTEPETVIEEGADEYMTKADAKKLVTAIKTEVRGVLTEREEQARIEYANRMLGTQQNAALNEIGKYANRLNVPEDVYNGIVKDANEIVPLWGKLDGPQRVTRYVMERMEHWKTQHVRETKMGQDLKNDAAMIDHNKKTLQPAGSGIAPPSQSEFEKAMQEAADAIAPDDPPVRTS